jgi:hypothetical protein
VVTNGKEVVTTAPKEMGIRDLIRGLMIVRLIDSPTLKCRLCKEERPAREIMDGAGDCAFCALQKVRT